MATGEPLGKPLKMLGREGVGSNRAMDYKCSFPPSVGKLMLSPVPDESFGSISLLDWTPNSPDSIIYGHPV